MLYMQTHIHTQTHSRPCMHTYISKSTHMHTKHTNILIHIYTHTYNLTARAEATTYTAQN